MATFLGDGLGFAVSAAAGTALRLGPIATAERNKPSRTKTHFDGRHFRFDMKKTLLDSVLVRDKISSSSPCILSILSAQSFII